MRKAEFIEHLLIDNQTSGNKQKLYADVIDCTDIALSQMPDTFKVKETIGLEELYGVIEGQGKKAPCHCVGPFEAAELIATHLGATYVRASVRVPARDNIIKLEDLF